MTLEELLAKVPGVPLGVNDDFILTSEGVLGASDRKILRYLLKSSLPSAPPDLLATARTVGDLRSLFEGSDELTRAPELLEITEYVSRSVYMRPVMPSDHEQLYFAALEPSNSYRWRFRGQTPGFREFSDTFHHGSHAQFVFASPVDNRLITLCSAYAYDSNAQHCTFAVQRLDFEDSFSTSTVESVALFLNYLFRSFHLRKVFADLPEYNVSSFGVVEGVFDVEGRRRDYFWHAGRFWDDVTIATTREKWTAFAAQFFTSGVEASSIGDRN